VVISAFSRAPRFKEEKGWVPGASCVMHDASCMTMTSLLADPPRACRLSSPWRPCCSATPPIPRPFRLHAGPKYNTNTSTFGPTPVFRDGGDLGGPAGTGTPVMTVACETATPGRRAAFPGIRAACTQWLSLKRRSPQRLGGIRCLQAQWTPGPFFRLTTGTP
jgi:hypothetical protein